MGTIIYREFRKGRQEYKDLETQNGRAVHHWEITVIDQPNLVFRNNKSGNVFRAKT